MLGWGALLWLLEGIDIATGNALDAFGIQPREPAELVDIVPAAFLHFGFDHLAANTVPLLVLGFVAALRAGYAASWPWSRWSIVASGLGVWLTAAPDSNTAGASGVVFGLFGYLLVRGFIERKLARHRHRRARRRGLRLDHLGRAADRRPASAGRATSSGWSAAWWPPSCCGSARARSPPDRLSDASRSLGRTGPAGRQGELTPGQRVTA